jgi:four helix bundle protein
MKDGEWKMNGRNEVLELSFQFAVRIVNLCKYLKNEKKEYVLSKQLLRAGTSIGANITEAQDAQSKKDFISKMAISLKEAKETRYWIALLIKTEYLPENSKKVQSLQEELQSLINLLSSISISAKNRLT